jgi:Tol biopolymer transport system component
VRKLALAGLLLLLAVPSAGATTPRILASLDWWPVPSPDGKVVAFTRVYANWMQLDVVNVKTRRVTKVGRSASQLSPSWSSDNAKLAYASGGVLYVVNANGTGKHRYAAPQKSFAPAWRPASTQLAYLTTHGAQNTDLWVAGTLWAKNAIGRPAWSPNGTQLAFQRDDGIYVATGPGAESKLVGAVNPGPPAWSHDGKKLVYTQGKTVYEVSGGTATVVTHGLTGLGTPSFSSDDTSILLPYAGGVAFVNGQTGGQVIGARGPGAAYLGPTKTVVASWPVPGCPGHTGLGTGDRPLLTGSCVIQGTPGADVIEGTPLWGDVIDAGSGNDRIHANDGHTDRVNCGPGRDTVWADRTDRLTDCEIVHR